MNTFTIIIIRFNSTILEILMCFVVCKWCTVHYYSIIDIRGNVITTILKWLFIGIN